MANTTQTSDGPHEIAAVRLPPDLRRRAKAKAQREDMTFSQLMRRALRRELDPKRRP